MIFDTLPPALFTLLPFALAALAPLLFTRIAKHNVTGWILALFPLATFGYLLVGAFESKEAPIWFGEIAWAPALGLNWNLWASPLSFLHSLLVSGVGFLVLVYANGYLTTGPEKGRLFGMLFLFMGAMMGISLTEHLLVFFLFWELTSIASYLLIGFYHAKIEARKSALDALLITAGGGLALLAGIILLGEVGGSYRISELVENRDAIVSSPLYPAVFICILIGAITKSAQFPFHFWLPGAMTAPAPVSAYLHSATMVKAGVFLLALMHPILGGTPWWHFTLMGFGALTMTWAALVAVVQTDLKRLLAYTTASALGTLVMLLGIEHTLAAKAAVLFLIVHALYKGSLFMVAGIIEKATGTRDVSQLRGLIRTMPILGIAAVFAALSMSGIPPFIGFIAKELLYEVKLETPIVGWSLLVCGFLANAANIVVAAKVGIAPFLGRLPDSFSPKKLPGVALCLGPVVLGIGSLLLGIFPQTILGDSLSATVSQIKTEDVEIKIYIWHGFNLVLLLSALTMLAGAIGFFFRNQLTAAAVALRERLGWNGQASFRAILAGVLAAAGAITRFIQNGNLRVYLFIIFASGTALVAWAFSGSTYRFEIPAFLDLRFDVAIVALFIAVSTILLLSNRTRMTSILLLGCVGFGISALFALYGAPDLAITQLLVETLTLVLFALAVRRLPALDPIAEALRGRGLSLLMGVAVGVAFTLLTLKALEVEIHTPVSLEIAARSLPEAFGKNVVNVILVDFRALDTLGEICVLAIAALGVSAMLKKKGAETTVSRLQPKTSAVLIASARFTAPAMVAFSVYLLLRGHNEPGGGFIGGLVGAMAVILIRLAHPERPLLFARLGPIGLIASGLLAAAVSGLPGLLTTGNFLAAEWGPSFSLPILGKIALGTPLVFDIGVYAVVVGITLLLFEQFERARNVAKPLPLSP